MLETVSWDYEEIGRSSDGIAELTSIVGEGHGFTTVKPMKLMSKIIESGVLQTASCSIPTRVPGLLPMLCLSSINL